MTECWPRAPGWSRRGFALAGWLPAGLLGLRCSRAWPAACWAVGALPFGGTVPGLLLPMGRVGCRNSAYGGSGAAAAQSHAIPAPTDPLLPAPQPWTAARRCTAATNPIPRALTLTHILLAAATAGHGGLHLPGRDAPLPRQVPARRHPLLPAEVGGEGAQEGAGGALKGAAGLDRQPLVVAQVPGWPMQLLRACCGPPVPPHPRSQQPPLLPHAWRCSSEGVARLVHEGLLHLLNACLQVRCVHCRLHSRCLSASGVSNPSRPLLLSHRIYL